MTASSGRNGKRAAVAQVHHVRRRRSVAQQPRGQLHRGLGVEGAASLRQQLRLLVERRVGVQLQQPPLDLGHLRGPRRCTRAARGPPRRGRRSSAGSRTAPRPASSSSSAGSPTDAAISSTCDSSSSGSRSTPFTHAARSHVRWLSPTWSSSSDSGGTPSEAAKRRWNPIATLHSPTARCPACEQRPGDDADRVGEVDDPRVRCCLGDPLGDVEHDRHGPQRLGQPARAGRLLPDAAALQRPGLVLVAGGLAADPQLEQHRVHAVERGLEGRRRDQLSRVAQPREDPPPDARDQLEPLGRRVDEHQLVDRAARPAAGRARRRARGCTSTLRRRPRFSQQLHPLTPVSVTPSMKALWARKNSAITGAITSSVAAMVRFQLVWWALLNVLSP